MSVSVSSLWFMVLFSFVLSYGEASHQIYRNLESIPSSSSQDQPYRTGYHFQPPKNWMNGPMIYKGLYHLFYQYNPYGAVWGNIVWAHSTSKDLINWVPHPIAIFPSQPSDINGCWSGSATLIPMGKDIVPHILYTGINKANQQVQNLALPKNLSDPYLIEWVKVPQNPLMAPTSANQINASSFRDPTTAWRVRGEWRVIIGNKKNRRGKAILYRSKDFTTWAEAKHPLHSSPKTGMWECPDFYPVSTSSQVGLDTSFVGKGTKHILKVSLDDKKHDYYYIGNYIPKNDTFIPDGETIESVPGLRYDYGKYYASKTFYDSVKHARILWGWVNESSSTADDIKKGWSGIQAIPRTVWLDKSGKQVIQWPIQEVEELRGENPSITMGPDLESGSRIEITRITSAQADVEAVFGISDFKMAEAFDPSWTDPQLLCSQKGTTVKGGLGPFGLLVLASDKLEEYTAVFFRVFKSQEKYVVLLCSDQSRSSLNGDNDKTTYGAFVDVDPIDHSVVESFGGLGKAVITARVYPTLAIGDKAHLYAFNYGSETVTINRLYAWSMKNAKLH
ncbi:Glycosyl hydrolase family 32, N-terminal [Dillenia turbinata]|uniref:Glycosyl hydrolase family 32, N-terminal n=1 Tax=Dillenia turbinata TaxID=194707 RepID=A0AAN8UAQ5_9MAGN